MSIKINLKPSPAADYFTVREHHRTLINSSLSAEELYSEIDRKVKTLFNFSSSSRTQFVNKEDLGDLFLNSNVIVKDDPFTGIDELKFEDPYEFSNEILDLSYSFPQLPTEYPGFRHFLIDPALSLGIPGDVALFVTNGNESFESRSNEKSNESLILLNSVLNDFILRGKEVLLRESNYKAAVLYQMIEDSQYLNLKTEKSFRSKTIILAECDTDFIDTIGKMGYEVGIANMETSPAMAIGNYPTHSKELIEMFADRVAAL